MNGRVEVSCKITRFLWQLEGTSTQNRWSVATKTSGKVMAGAPFTSHSGLSHRNRCVCVCLCHTETGVSVFVYVPQKQVCLFVYVPQEHMYLCLSLVCLCSIAAICECGLISNRCMCVCVCVCAYCTHLAAVVLTLKFWLFSFCFLQLESHGDVWFVVDPVIFSISDNWNFHLSYT